MNKVAFLISFIFLVLQDAVLTLADSTSTQPPLSNFCLDCICQASSGCNRSAAVCEGDVCGLFRITKAYWIDAGRHVTDGDDPQSDAAYNKCTLNEVCAGTTVTSYVTRFAQDCNEDGKINCYDYAAVHHRGGYGGCKKQPLVGSYLNRFTECNERINKQGASTTHS